MRPVIRPALAGVLVLMVSGGCAGAPAPVDGARAAEAAYVACAEERGVTVAGVDIGPDTFDVRFAGDPPRAAVAALRRHCEPQALAVLEGGAQRAASQGPGATAPSAARDQAAAPVPPEGITDADGYVAHLAAQGFTGALLVTRGGDTAVRTALGLADRGGAVPNTVDTAFDIGSIAKTFTAAAVLGLVDDGALALDDTLGALLADVPADKRGITVRQLLDFTSGLGEYHDTDGDFEVMSRRQALQRILAQDLRFAPGTDTAYSNSSYTLAAIIVEEVTGRDFSDVVGDLFAMARLRDTGFYGSAALRETPVATGYEGDRHGRNDPASWAPTWALLGAGGIASTIDDVHRWWRALQEPGLLRPESVRVLAAALPAQPLGGMEVRGVGGTNDFGFDAAVLEIVGDETVIVVLSNGNPPDRSIASDAAVVLAQLLAR